MYLESLRLNNFKNFSFFEQDFSSINCIVGNNGVGKTNILDAVYYLSFSKSFHSNNDLNTMKYGEDFFAVFGTYVDGNQAREHYSCSQKKGEKKKFFRNKNPYKRLSEHIGKIPCVIISPFDYMLITGSSEYRRRFMDIVLSQTDNVYLENLTLYNRSLQQKNKLLKFMQQNQYFDTLQLDIWNGRLVEYAQIIQEKRYKFFESFQSYFQFFYDFISDKKETPFVKYKTYEGNLSEKMLENAEKEKILGYTLSGIHRDDLLFFLDGHNVQEIGSQGQQKTFILAMKLAQYSFLKEQKGHSPLLLLDDIFDKFDFMRVEKILDLVSGDDFGQIFLTDTHLSRVEQIIPQSKKDKSTIIRL
ncbi:MAG: DNA replication and repair protein RecF [Bacteroidales bacterium]|nr:DNA replication and repair protein RecF [Bacteroidales bacterium]